MCVCCFVRCVLFDKTPRSFCSLALFHVPLVKKEPLARSFLRSVTLGSFGVGRTPSYGKMQKEKKAHQRPVRVHVCLCIFFASELQAFELASSALRT